MIPDQLPDTVVEQVREGDFSAFETLFNRYWEALYQYTARILGSGQDAQDLVQDLFTDLWERREQLQLSTHIRYYLFSAARKKILCKFRDDGLKEKHLEQFVLHGELRSELTLNTLIHKDILSQLQEDLHALPEKERQVFTWYHFDELSIREIALINGTAEQTVRNQLNNAYRKAQGMISKLLYLL
ncbi:RNA polymerase sigma factor [Chitinophaga japonensis]|uniref:RNA polymerase sigma-70 factor (ECF subfamily) n=1 Tax=Chitinophaga japonensis TaxID=104662 RepID=A0A562STN4_CHIJA|nr:sigma-70 family RNA polymerase sigma factor [Chitinophaga japonensis]TWI84483.1 RNA polymerase sigma-70 factor (ECF subfamily) [Chitinophaga japonensis]